MALTIPVTWNAPSDQGATTTYKITRVVHNVETVLASAQASNTSQAEQTYSDTYTPGAGLHIWYYRVYRAESTDPTNFSPPAVMAAVSPSQPQDVSHCTVYGFIGDAGSGNTLQGVTVAAELSANEAFDSLGRLLRASPQSTLSDQDGYWEFSLIRQRHIINPATSHYRINIQGTSQSVEIVVPDQHAANIADIEGPLP